MRLNDKRICMVLHSYYKIDTRVRKEAEYLARNGFEVDVICLKLKGEQSRECFRGVSVIRANVSRSRQKTKTAYILEYASFFIRASCKLLMLFVKRRYKTIVIHNMPNFLVFSALIPKWFGTKVILDMHDTMPELYTDLFGLESDLFKRLLYLEEKLSARFADALMTVNRPIASMFEERTGRQCFLLHNSPDPLIFSEQKKRYVLGRGVLQLVYHGNLHKRTGLESVVHAVHCLNQEYVKYELNIYGDGPHRTYLESMVAELNASSYVKFFGRYKPEDIIGDLVKYDVGVVPYLVGAFGDILLPVKLLEYIHLKIPVICRKLKTPSEYFSEDAVYFYSDEEQFKTILCKLRSNYETASRRAQVAYEEYLPMNWDCEGLRFLDFVRETIAS